MILAATIEKAFYPRLKQARKISLIHLAITICLSCTTNALFGAQNQHLVTIVSLLTVPDSETMKNMESERHTSHSSANHKRHRIEWPTIGLMVLCYGLWIFAGLYLYPSMPILALLLMALAVALHSSLQHEALHGHPTRNGTINELLVSVPLGMFYPFRRYKHLHLKHHADERLTDPYDDPESYFRALGDWNKLPRAFENLAELEQYACRPGYNWPCINGSAGFLISEFKLVSGGERKTRNAWVLHLLGLIPMLVVVWALFDIPLWIYTLTAAYWGLSIIAIRTYCEHQWSERPDGRTIIVEKSPLALLFLNNNLHFVHHKRPTAPWYDLPQIYDEQRDEWQRMNGGYVFRTILKFCAPMHSARSKRLSIPC